MKIGTSEEILFSFLFKLLSTFQLSLPLSVSLSLSVFLSLIFILSFFICSLSQDLYLNFFFSFHGFPQKEHLKVLNFLVPSSESEVRHRG